MGKFSSLLLILIFLMSACTNKKPTSSEVKGDSKPSEMNSSPPAPADLDGIKKFAENSSCAKVNWANRGIAPKGYIKGMALVYARSVCNPHKVVSKETHGAKDKDALAYYGIQPSNKNTYAFLIGLGMRESSGKHCCGRDASASNTSSTTAEAGMFQTSYNASSADSSLPGLLKDNSKQCYLETFKEGVTCTSYNWSNYGSGDGLAFQVKAKNCPSFAAEFAAVTLRTLRAHYGPINRKEVQFKNECVDMLTEIETIVKNNPQLCEVLK